MTSFKMDREEFYKRQTAMPELGVAGQDKISSSKVTIVGVGGLGSVAAALYTLAGVGRIRIIDQDTLEMHNLHRQLLFSIEDVHLPKVEAAKRSMKKINPEVEVEAIAENLNWSNSLELLEDSDVIVDGLDNMATRYLVNRVAVRRDIPYVFAGAIGLEGNISVFTPKKTPCLECVLPGLADENLPTCETRGVLGVTTGLIGSLESAETIKILLGIDSPLQGKLLFVDLKQMSFDMFEITKNPQCATCSAISLEEGLPERNEGLRWAWMCGAATVNVNPDRRLELDLEQVRDRVQTRYRVLRDSEMAVIFGVAGVEISLFRNGRMLIKNVSTEEEALAVHRSLVRELRLG
ncbi:MAG: ThiF family adenylyltransferase [Candidatus Geothermarchaeales archaeon]